jgi:molybdopterin-guanine dinucleotide biosynthesis protein A
MAAAAYILTGGRSSRMGRDKALLPYRGATLVEWIAAQAREVCSSVTLVGAPERYRQLGLPCLAERYAGCGPLSGIEAALRHRGGGWSLIVACDMPRLTPELFGGMLAAAERSPADVVAAEPRGGRLEPLCAVWNQRALPAVEAALAAGRYAVRGLFTELQVLHYSIDSEMLTRNVNSPEDWLECSR